MALRILHDDPDLEMMDYPDSGGMVRFTYKGEPFTGFLIEYYPNGKLAGELEYEDSYSEGWKRLYFPNGQLQQEYRACANQTVKGTFKKYDEQGNLLTSF
jgi:antitoxin component YwqK of YwqJK toxin-antitoxin module